MVIDAGCEGMFRCRHQTRAEQRPHSVGCVCEDLGSQLDAEPKPHRHGQDHHRSGASMTLKNWYGLLGGRRNIFHQDVHTIIQELAMMIHPTLVVLDGVYTGTLKLKSGITIQAKNPRRAVFSGLEHLETSFREHSVGIYKAKIEGSLKQLFYDDQPMTWARRDCCIRSGMRAG